VHEFGSVSSRSTSAWSRIDVLDGARSERLAEPLEHGRREVEAVQGAVLEAVMLAFARPAVTQVLLDEHPIAPHRPGASRSVTLCHVGFANLHPSSKPSAANTARDPRRRGGTRSRC
jgi:hypothetical protein